MTGMKRPSSSSFGVDATIRSLRSPNPRAFRTLFTPSGRAVELTTASIDDFIDVGLVHIGVPNRLWVDHHHGAAGTAIQTPRLVDTHATLAVESQGFDTGFAVLPRLLRSVVGATGFAAFALLGMSNRTAWWYSPSGRKSPEEIADAIADLGVRSLVRHDRGRNASTIQDAIRTLQEDLQALERFILDNLTRIPGIKNIKSSSSFLSSEMSIPDNSVLFDSE